jgi:hypothetical protein
VKLWGTARVIEGDEVLLSRLADPSYAAGRPQRAIVFTVEAWDVNCPQHIHRRFSERQLRQVLKPLQTRIEELEAEVVRLRGSTGTKSE